ncbi:MULTISPECIES: YggT family protein [Desulfovibrionaceae]|uniref:YggT family protein n=1 Tax=Desulfovibrionaceae TaxID=194924 RepID=UPI0013D8BE58|nr:MULTISPECIES: YggT family protein [Desulfovibrionaceae]NDV28232.1 YggT family protein [Desulfovibrio sp. JC010]
MDYVILAVAKVLSLVLNLYMWVVIISALITWVNPDPYNPIVRFLRSVTEPVFAKVRQYLPFVNIGGFDLSPIVVLLAIQMIDIALVGNLTRLAYGM